jgi:alcohol dehydrogenase class IV
VPADLTQLPNARAFVWRDGDRVVHFGDGALGEAPATLEAHGWDRYELLTTERALAVAPVGLAEGAGAVHRVPQGKVADTSAAVLDDVTVPTLVALGGGRVIDSAKAIAAVRGGRVAAIPTTLSGAEITGVHRLPEGHRAPHLVRPALAIDDPGPMTDLPEGPLRATAMNALGHGADALFGPAANPVSSLVGVRGVELIAGSLDQPPESRDRAALALGSVLCAHAIDGAGFSLHHAVCQELVRGVGVPHAETNAAMLPLTMTALGARVPAAAEALAQAVGTDLPGLAGRLTQLGGGPRRLGAMGAERGRLEATLDRIEARLPGAMRDPPPAAELRQLVEAAW